MQNEPKGVGPLKKPKPQSNGERAPRLARALIKLSVQKKQRAEWLDALEEDYQIILAKFGSSKANRWAISQGFRSLWYGIPDHIKGALWAFIMRGVGL